VKGVLRHRLGESLRTFRDVFRNPSLRRVELAWAGSITGEWSYAIALAVYAYEAGGATAVGVVGMIRFLPSAVVAPFAALLGDRFRRERVMLAADLVRAAAMALAAAAVALDAPAGAVYALAGFVAVVSTAFQPAKTALLPSLARTPEELTAANVASSTIDSVGSFAGPALGGILLALTSTEVVFAATAGTFLWSAMLVQRLEAERPGGAPRGPERRLGEEALAGFRTIAADGRLRLLVGLFSAQTLVAGALNVLIVVAALELLDLGEAGPGYLNSAVGIGGLAGAALALALVGRRRLAGDFGAGLVLWGLPLVAIGLWPEPAVALAVLALLGVGNTLVDVSALTLLQRAVPGDVLARVFGVLESLIVGTIGLGAILAPLLVGGLGVRGALVATGALLPVLAALSWRRLRALDAEASPPPGAELELLRSIPIFAPLPAAALEHLAASLVRTQLATGSEVFRQGDAGDRFYVVGAGSVAIEIDGARSSELGPGEFFGEIALLHDVPRTATARAASDAELYSLDRDEFIAAVTGHPASVEAADAVIGARLGSLRPGMASL
jgi:MFS family permease